MLQPGSGSTDGIGSLQYAFRAFHADLDWTASFSYQVNGVNRHGYRFGNEAIAAVGVSHSLVVPF
jgi:hypothetical protein